MTVKQLKTSVILFCNGDLTLTLTGRWSSIRARAGRGGFWAGLWLVWIRGGVFAEAHMCGGVFAAAICLPSQSVLVIEVGCCLGVWCQTGGDVGVLRTGPVEADVLVYRV